MDAIDTEDCVGWRSFEVAEGKGFEPLEPAKVHFFSKEALSTTQPTFHVVAPGIGLEPITSSLTARRSTIELSRKVSLKTDSNRRHPHYK